MTVLGEGERYSLGDVVAFGVLVVSPFLAFGTLPLPGIFNLLLILPLLVLVVTYVRRPETVFPTWEWALIAVLGLSVLWSDVPDYSAERLRTYLPLLLTTVVAASQLKPARIVRALTVSFVLFLFTSAVVLALEPATRIRNGEFVITAGIPKNTFGALLGLSAVLLLAQPRRYNRVLVPIVALAIALNYSVTAWITTTVVVLGSLAARWAARELLASSVAPALLVVVLLGVGAFGLVVLAGTSSALEALGKDDTLSTRTEIWAACWEQIKAAPLLGHGAFTFLDNASNSPVTQYVDTQFQSYRPPHPHNGLLDVWGQLGLLGVAVYFGMMLTGLGRGVRMLVKGDQTARAGATVVAFILLFGATEPTSLGPWLTVAMPCTIACKRAWALRRDGQPRGSAASGSHQPEDRAAEGPQAVVTGSRPPLLARDR